MAKYKTLKQERDEAVARAMEAERLSNIEVVRKLEAELESVKRERDEARQKTELLLEKLGSLTDTVLEMVHLGVAACEGAVRTGQYASGEQGESALSIHPLARKQYKYGKRM